MLSSVTLATLLYTEEGVQETLKIWQEFAEARKDIRERGEEKKRGRRVGNGGAGKMKRAGSDRDVKECECGIGGAGT